MLIADQSVPAAVTDRILDEAREAAIDCVLLTARFESRYFREAYLERLVAANLPLIRRANLVLVATADDAGAYALHGARRARRPHAGRADRRRRRDARADRAACSARSSTGPRRAGRGGPGTDGRPSCCRSGRWRAPT